MRWVEEAQGGKLTRTRGKGERRCGCAVVSSGLLRFQLSAER
jgi:hypothetical protein